MKKSVKIISTIMSGLILLSAVPTASVSAAGKVEDTAVTVKNLNKGIKISWEKAVNAEKYKVMRKLSTAKKFKTLKTVKKAKGGAFTDRNVKAGKTYIYKVRAINKISTADSDEKKIVRLERPSVFDGTALNGCIHISTNSYIKGAEKYQVYCADVKKGKIGKYYKVGTFDANDPWGAYQDYYTTKGVFSYKIRAVSGDSYSAFSKPVTVDFIMNLEVFANVNKNYSGVDITWRPMYEADGFRIYRSADGAEPELIADIGQRFCRLYPDTMYTYPEYYYTDETGVDGVEYLYTIEAYSGNKVLIREESMSTVTYQSAAYVLKVGETSTAIVDEIATNKSLFAEMGMEVDFSVAVVSRNPDIVTVDENNNLIGKSAGKTYIEKTITTVTDGEETSVTKILSVKVAE